MGTEITVVWSSCLLRHRIFSVVPSLNNFGPKSERLCCSSLTDVVQTPGSPIGDLFFVNFGRFEVMMLVVPWTIASMTCILLVIIFIIHQQCFATKIESRTWTSSGMWPFPTLAENGDSALVSPVTATAMSVEEPAPKRRRLRKAPSGGKEGCYHMSKNQKPELFRVYRGSHSIHVW